MNDRIKQLIMEAVNFGLDPDSDAYEAQICPEDLEYLAELIVKECLSNMEDCDGDLDFAIWKTKTEFGVKE